MSPLSEPSARADRQRNDGAILLAAARVLARDANASMQAVADAAGLSRLTVYRRFPTREALIAAVADAVDGEANALLEAFPGWQGGEESFRWLVTALGRMAGRYPSAVRHGVDARTDRVERFDARLVALLGQGQGAGVLRGDLDPELLGVVLLGAVRSVTLLHPDAEQVQAVLADLLLTGMTAPPAG